MLDLVKKWLKELFLDKDLSEAKYILRIKIYIGKPKQSIGLSQGLILRRSLLGSTCKLKLRIPPHATYFIT